MLILFAMLLAAIAPSEGQTSDDMVSVYSLASGISSACFRDRIYWKWMEVGCSGDLVSYRLLATTNALSSTTFPSGARGLALNCSRERGNYFETQTCQGHRVTVLRQKGYFVTARVLSTRQPRLPRRLSG